MEELKILIFNTLGAEFTVNLQLEFLRFKRGILVIWAPRAFRLRFNCSNVPFYDFEYFMPYRGVCQYFG